MHKVAKETVQWATSICQSETSSRLGAQIFQISLKSNLMDQVRKGGVELIIWQQSTNWTCQLASKWQEKVLWAEGVSVRTCKWHKDECAHDAVTSAARWKRCKQEAGKLLVWLIVVKSGRWQVQQNLVIQSLPFFCKWPENSSPDQSQLDRKWLPCIATIQLK